MATIFGLGKHSHDTDKERDHLTNSLIVAFGVFLLAIVGYGFYSGQLVIEGTFLARDLWSLFAYIVTGLFAWVLRGKVERWRSDNLNAQNGAPPSAQSGGDKG